jgi:hypothetical protein
MNDLQTEFTDKSAPNSEAEETRAGFQIPEITWRKISHETAREVCAASKGDMTAEAMERFIAANGFTHWCVVGITNPRVLLETGRREQCPADCPGIKEMMPGWICGAAAFVNIRTKAACIVAGVKSAFYGPVHDKASVWARSHGLNAQIDLPWSVWNRKGAGYVVVASLPGVKILPPPDGNTGPG